MPKQGDKTKAEVLRKNPKVDANLVKQFQKLESELQRLGVDTKPKYTIEHPLNGRHTMYYNH